MCADANRSDDRNHIGSLEPVEHTGGDPLWFADKPEIDLHPDTLLDLSVNQLARLDEPAILAAQSDRTTALAIDRRDELFVDRSSQNHLDHFHRLAVGNAQAID